MKQEKLHDAMNLLEDDLLLETDTLRRKKKNRVIWLRWGALAACLCLLLAGTFLAGEGHIGHDGVQIEPYVEPENPGNPTLQVNQGGAKTDDLPDGNEALTVDDTAPGDCADRTKGELGVHIEPMNVNLRKNPEVAADMLAFFIYQGRSYVEDCRLKNGAALVGDYVATATGLIDEWTEEDGYVDLAGSVSGDFYTVKGYDPDFMLCMKEDNGDILVFVNNSGLILRYGAELYENRLKLDNGYTQVEYETRKSWASGMGQVNRLSEAHSETMELFLRVLNEGRFMYLSDIPMEDGKTDIYSAKEIYHLYVYKADGMVIHLRLFDGGYVLYQGLMGVCVQVDEEIFNQLIEILEREG